MRPPGAGESGESARWGIVAIVFDLDSTLTDCMRMKEAAIQAAIDGMIDAGFRKSREELRRRVQAIYDVRGLEFQRVFDELLEREFGEVDPKILASGVVAYRRARESALVLYPHAQMTLLELAKRGIRLGVVSDAPRFQVWLRLCSLGLQHVFDAVEAFADGRAFDNVERAVQHQRHEQERIYTEQEATPELFDLPFLSSDPDLVARVARDEEYRKRLLRDLKGDARSRGRRH